MGKPGVLIQSSEGGDSAGVREALASDVQQVGATGRGAFAAVKAGGAVVTWGHARRGGDSTAVRTALTSEVEKVVGNGAAFAAVKAGGALVTWGQAGAGGDSAAVLAMVNQ